MPLIELTTLLTTTVVPAITTIITTAAAKASAIYASGAVAWVEPDGAYACSDGRMEAWCSMLNAGGPQ